MLLYNALMTRMLMSVFDLLHILYDVVNNLYPSMHAGHLHTLHSI